MRADARLLIGVTLATLSAIAGSVAASSGPVAIVSGVAFVLVLPGLALMTALFPRGGPSLAHRVVWAAGSSLAVTVLSGLVLNLFGTLTRDAWLAVLAEIALAGIAIACIRRIVDWRRSAPEESPPPAVRAPSPARRPALVAYSVLVVAISLCALAIAIARLSAESDGGTGFTELSLVPAVGDAARAEAVVAVKSHENETRGYHVMFEGPRNQRSTWSFRLPPGRRWQRAVHLHPGGRFVATLVPRGGADTTRRQVFLDTSAGSTS